MLDELRGVLRLQNCEDKERESDAVDVSKTPEGLDDVGMLRVHHVAIRPESSLWCRSSAVFQTPSSCYGSRCRMRKQQRGGDGEVAPRSEHLLTSTSAHADWLPKSDLQIEPSETRGRLRACRSTYTLAAICYAEAFQICRLHRWICWQVYHPFARPRRACDLSRPSDLTATLDHVSFSFRYLSTTAGGSSCQCHSVER